MKDAEIIRLYQNRSQQAITETAQKYQCYCTTIANRILNDRQDTEECLNDTWLKAWNSIPPQIPTVLSAYLGKITRNLALNMYKKKYAKKRIDDRMMVSLEELKDCISLKDSVESQTESREIVTLLNAYLEQTPELERKIFVRRYFYLDTLKEIAQGYELKESYVKTSLFRSRQKLKLFLEQEGVVL